MDVRGFTRLNSWTCGHIADKQDHVAGDQPDSRRSGGMLTDQDERSVKPSAKPSLVRTQHLPHPGETAPYLPIFVLAGRFFSVPRCVILWRLTSACRGVHGRIADENRGLGAVRGPSAFHGRPRTGAATTDEGPGARCAGLTFAVELSVDVPASARCPAGFRGPGRPGKDGCGDGQGGGPGERDAGRAGGTGADRPRVRRRGARTGAPGRRGRG